MTSPNHIVGGIAITGISLSFWDINIFSNSIYLGLCVFSSLLPDIDHTKSVMGKIFFPLARYLDKNFGHRTITHSLTVLVPLFIFFCFIELNIINPYYERTDLDFSLIFGFSFLSHLILDMLTVQGIPLFYPFLKNPCVIPANPTLRFRSGNIRSEAIALFIFTFVLISSYDLFQNGFWTTYNRSFGTIKHAYREFREGENIVSVTYEYSYNGIKKKGFGYILDATENMVELWINNNNKPYILKIDNEDLRTKNISIEPRKTIYKYSINDLNFFNLTLQQINDTLKNKVVSGKIISSKRFVMNQRKAEKGSIELHKEISPKFIWIQNDTIKKELSDKIELKEAKLNEIYTDNYNEKKKLESLKNALNNYKVSLKKSTSIYDKNKYEKLMIKQKNKIANFTMNLKNTSSLNEEINILKRQLEYSVTHYFTGAVKIFSVPGKKLDLVVNN